MATRVAAICVLAVALGACNSLPSSPGPTAAAATQSPNELAAIDFRTQYGLRADVDYVRSVAADPKATSTDFGVPLVPAELTELRARPSDPHGILEAIQPYADLHPSDFGGMWQDADLGGVTVLWVRNLAIHAEAVWKRVRPGSRVTFGYATYAYRDLRALQDRIGGDWDWMRPYAIAPTGVAVDEAANRVRLAISSANTDAPALILAHYGVPGDMLQIVSDGTGAALIPRGTVAGHVLDSLGKPPGQAVANLLNLGWSSDGPGDCGGGEIGYGVTGDGRFELPCQAGGHTIVVQVHSTGGNWSTIATGHVVVIAGKTVALTIRLNTPWSAITRTAAP